MRDGNDERQKLPFRRWRSRPRPDATAKLNLARQANEGAIVPFQVRIEVTGGRDASANIVRAYRVLKQIEEAGGLGKIIEVAGDGSALAAEVDLEQAQSLAHSPFVRRIVSMN